MNARKEKAKGNPRYKDTTFRIDYESSFDGFEDWALAEEGKSGTWIICLHGHGSDGTQLFSRQDIAEGRLKFIRDRGLGILAPNLRFNAWMCPAAVHDLNKLIHYIKTEFSAEKFILFSASMGGTGSLIYSVLHPEDIDGVIAGCPATDIGNYYNWAMEQELPVVLDEIRKAIAKGYDGTPVEKPELYEKHSALKNFEKLTMPLHLCHGNSDLIIPVSESRALAEKLAAKKDFLYREIENGHHDAPLAVDEASLEWMLEQI